MAATPWLPVAEGVSLTIRLTPKADRDAIDGIETMPGERTVLKVRVRAAPSEGEANAALIKLIASAVAVPPRDVNLVAGATSRVKRIVISGDGPTLIAMLEKIAIPR